MDIGSKRLLGISPPQIARPSNMGSIGQFAKSGLRDGIAIQSLTMFDLLATIGSAVVAYIIERVISAGIDWGKRRNKPPAQEVRQKVEEFVTEAAQAAPLPETLPAAA